jgi:DNA-binding MarR family transcriptional regulator
MSFPKSVHSSSARPVTLTEDHLVSVLLVRRARNAIIGENLFSDPAWDILLELYAAKLGRRDVSLAELATAIGIPSSTSNRWVAALEERALLEPTVGAGEPSSRKYRLTAKGAERMERLASHWASAFVSI